MLVQELMTPNPITIVPEASLEEALGLMTRNDIHELPVVSGTRREGIITARDRRGALGNGAPETAELAREVHEVMSETVEVVMAETPMSEACRRLASLRISSVPVVGPELELIGILSITDILGAAADRFDD